MKNLKKLFASVASIAILASMFPVVTLGAASYSDELQDAYDYAYNVGITTMSSIDSANMYGALTRAHMAKMITNYAEEVFGLEPDTDKECSFTDLAGQTQEMKDYIEEACQLGLMGVGITAFNPNGSVTRAQFGTVLSRVLRGDENEGGDTYYSNHLAALKDAEIMNNISNPMANEIRGYVMLMMMRADDYMNDEGTDEICETPENETACSLGLDTCPEECQDDEPVVNANGNLEVSLASSEGGDVPYGINSLPVATYKITADEDITLDSVTLEQGGYSEDLTLDGVALFVDGARVSKIANIDTDEELTLNLTNSYDIKAGESVNVEVRASIPNSDTVAGDKFNLTLLSLESSAEDVDYDSDLTSDTFTILDKLNAQVYLTSVTPEELTLGDEAANLFDFKVTNSGTQNQELYSITLRASDSDFSTYYENFALEIDGDKVADGTVNGKYVTFNLDEAYLIEDGDNETFTVVADVVGGAGESAIVFDLEKKADLVSIGEKYDVPAYVLTTEGYDLASLTVSAGDVTLTKTNPGSTSIVRNRTNLSLGAFTIKNNAGGDLTLQDFDITFTTGAGAMDIDDVLKNVKVRVGSTSASLRTLEDTVSESVRSETDLGKSIGSSLTIYVYADTEDVAMDTANFTMKLENVVIEESANDEEVTDVSPTSLTFTTMKGSDSELKLTNVTLATKSVAKGSEDVEAVSFKIKTSTTEGAKISKLTFSGAAASLDSDTVSAATLYVGTDEYSADVRNGTIVVDDDITLAKNTTTTFVLKLNVQDTPEQSTIKYILASIDAKDTSADKNDLSVASVSGITGRTITVQSAATLSVSYEASTANNKYAKSILAGTTATVAEYEVYANYEDVNVGEIAVRFGAADLDDSVTDVELYYDGTLIASNPTWNGLTGTFEDLDFDISTTEKPLLVKVVTTTINADGGATEVATKVDSITFADLQGASSSDAVSTVVNHSDSSLFDIVPVTVFTSISDVTATTAKLNLAVNRGSNTTSGNLTAKPTITGVTLSVEGNNGGLTQVRIKNDAGETIGSWDVTGNTLSGTMAFDDQLLSAGTTTWTVYVTQSSADNPSYTLNINGVGYTTNVDPIATLFSDRAGVVKTIISK